MVHNESVRGRQAQQVKQYKGDSKMKKTFKSNVNGLNGINTTGMQIMQNEHGNVMLVVYKGHAYGTSNMGSNQLHEFLKSLVNGTCTIQPKARLSAEQREFIMANCPDVLEQHDKAWKSKKQEKRTSKNRVIKDSSRIDKAFGELSEEEKRLEARRMTLMKEELQQLKDSRRIDRACHSLIGYLKALDYTTDLVVEELKEDYNNSISDMARDYALNVLEDVTVEQVESQLRGLLGV